jgi:hypothetical protein
MDIAFQSKALRDSCESEDLLRTKFGELVGGAITRRLADLRAAVTIRDLVVGNPREVFSGKHPTLCIDLAENSVLLLRVNHLKPPINSNGTISWLEVTRLKVLSIGTTDGQSS